MHCGLIGFTADGINLPAGRSRRMQAHRFPLGLTREGHPSFRSVPCKVPLPESLAVSRTPQLPTVVFFPLRDIFCLRPLHTRHPKSRYVPPARFLNTSMVYSEDRLRRLVPSYDRVQGSEPFGDFPLRTAASARRRNGCPFVVASANAHRNRGHALRRFGRP